MVSDLVSEKFGIEKSMGFGIGKNLVLKKVSDSVSEIFGIGKKFRICSDFWFRHTLDDDDADDDDDSTWQRAHHQRRSRS